MDSMIIDSEQVEPQHSEMAKHIFKKNLKPIQVDAEERDRGAKSPFAESPSPKVMKSRYKTVASTLSKASKKLSYGDTISARLQPKHTKV